MDDRECAARIVDTGDVEMDHIRADAILCEILEELGYTETVAAFNRLPKWYA